MYDNHKRRVFIFSYIIFQENTYLEPNKLQKDTNKYVIH